MFDSRNIRAELARNGMSMKDLSNNLGISQNSLRYKLNGNREFTLTEVSKMADIFSCSLDYLANHEPRAG